MVEKARKVRSDQELYGAAVEACACNNLRKASRAVTQLFDQTLEPVGLRSTQLVLLLEILAAGSMTVPQLSRRLVIDRSTLQRNIGLLAEKHLIRIQFPKGKRSRTLTVTAHGRKTVTAAVPLWERAQSGFVGQLGEGRWAALRKDLAATVEAARSR